MAMFEFTLDDTMVGTAIGPPDGGYLVNLRQTQSQASYAVPDGDDGSGVWRSGYLVLRGSGDIRDLYCNCPSQCGVFDPAKTWVANSSLAYRGQLIVQSVPRGSVWALSLSDVPFVKAVDPFWATWSPSIHEHWRTLSRDAELVRR
jgi:hypothetical protein